MPKHLTLVALIFFLILVPVRAAPGQAQQVLIPPISLPEPDQPEHLPSYAGCGGLTAPLENDAYEQRVVEMVNAARAEHDLPPLKRSDPFGEAARYHAADLGQDNYFDHSTYDREGGELVFVCSAWARIGTYTAGGQAENIAAGFTTPQEVMTAWMESAGHRANILNPTSREIGVGYYSGSGDYQTYWVQDFGARDGEYPLIINGEAGTTDQTSVALFIYGDWDTVRLRNDAGVWSAWQAFHAEMNWMLPTTAGQHTVTAELRSATHLVTSHDTILLLKSEDKDLPKLGNLPGSLSFTYSLLDQELFPASQEVTPLNVGNGASLAWEAHPQGKNFSASPLTGTTPGPISILPVGLTTLSPGTYTGSLTVTIIDPPGVEGSPHTILLELRVVSTSIQHNYIPLTIHAP